MGVVFLAEAGAQSVALKVVRSSYLDNKSLHSRFVREIETLKKIDSPHAAKIFDYAVEQDTAWHAVEFVSGPTLKEKVEADGPLDADRWNTLASELQAALKDIHQQGIVHRDIKPANIVLGETGMKLIDFGIAQDDDATSLTMTGSVAGSPAWLSPERLEGKEDMPASDLFSAGAVLTFAATGRSPWGKSDTTTVSAIITRIIGGEPDLTGLSASQETLVRSLLQADPLNRAWVRASAPVASPASYKKVPPVREEPKPKTPAPQTVHCSCRGWERGWKNTEYRYGATHCLRCDGVIVPRHTTRTDTAWRAFFRRLVPSFLVLFASITVTSFYYITEADNAGALFFLATLITSFVLLVRECVRLGRENSGFARYGWILAALSMWGVFGVVVFIVNRFLINWLYWS